MRPATKLPWSAEEFSPEYGVEEYLVNGADGEIFTVAEQDDAAYIVHAANAYPRLVEALRDLATGRTQRNEAIALNLLSELGEDK